MSLTPTGAVYGVTKYGSEYYGASATNGAAFRWGIEVDWDGDGVFDGTNESSRMTDIQCNRGRKNFIQPNGAGFYPISVGVVHVTLSNHDGRYDPWNTSSPLYPNVTYGRDMRVRVVDVSTNTTYAVFYGIISDIVPSGYGENAIVKITAEDGLRFLRNVYYASTLGANTPPEDAIDNILTGVSWQTRWGRDLDTTTDNIPYFTTDGKSTAADDINSIADSFYGQFFVAADGKATYRDKKTVPVSVTDYNQNILLKDIGMPTPWIYSRNITKVFTSTYGSTSTSTSTYTTSPTQPRMFVLNATWLQSTSAGASAANILGAFLADFHPTPIVQLMDRPSYQFKELFTIITATIPYLGINGTSFKIGGIEHYGTPQELNTVFYLEPYLSADAYWTWPITNFGTDTIFGW